MPRLSDASSVNEQLAKVTKMIHKMKCTRGELLLRIGSLYRNADKKENDLKKRKEPDDEEQSTKRPRTYTELADALKILHQNASGDKMIDSNIDLLLACDGVRLYYIETGGEVTTSLQNSTLRVIKIEADHENNLEETVFLQLIKTCDVGVVAEDSMVEKDLSPAEISDESFEILDAPEEATGDVVPEDTMDPSFIYPLIPGVSPCFRTDYGAFILPDLHSTDGGAIGLILPTEADEIFQDILIEYLKGVVNESGAIEFGVEDAGLRNKRSTSDAVSSNIVKGANYISRGLIYSAEKAGDLMNYSTPYILSKMQKAPANAPPLSDNVHTGNNNFY